jgi:biotin carboxyl carrier protein
MKTPFFLPLYIMVLSHNWLCGETDDHTRRATRTVILDETGVRNLRIETEQAKERVFESTVFAIGRIEEIPANRSVLSTRIAGRVIDLNAYEGDRVEANQTLLRVESRQPGNPPPTIELRALRSGIVVRSHVRLGEPVEPDRALLDIADRSTLWAVAKIPESEAASVTLGALARIRVPALGKKVIEAHLLRFNVEADRSAGALEGIFQVSNPDGKLLPGMRIEFSIVTGSREKVLSVPQATVQGDPTNRIVFVKDFELENAFSPAPVVLGERNDKYVEIVSGLFPGDEVVTRGSYPLAFAGSGSGPSLKEALDAAHGHEHNEDGTEMTVQQKSESSRTDANDQSNGEATDGALNPYLIFYAATMTLLTALFAQRLWNKRKDMATA